MPHCSNISHRRELFSRNTFPCPFSHRKLSLVISRYCYFLVMPRYEKVKYFFFLRHRYLGKISNALPLHTAEIPLEYYFIETLSRSTSNRISMRLDELCTLHIGRQFSIFTTARVHSVRRPSRKCTPSLLREESALPGKKSI